VIQRAIMHVQSASNGKKEVTGANVLVAIFGEKDSHAVYYLHQQGVTRLDVVNFISHGVRKDQRRTGQSLGRRRRRAPAAKASQGKPARPVHPEPEQGRRRRQDRSADRPRRGSRA
jgi:ATP-dependent Clp protease ATP-binding subunit ClpA